MNIRVSLRALLRGLLVAIICLVVLHVVLQFIYLETSLPMLGAIPDRFNLDNEVSIPTWFSQMQLALAALLLAVVGYISYKKDNSDWRYWGLLGAVFAYMSVDEGSELHEIAARPMRDILGVQEHSGLFSNAWVVVAVPLLAVLFVVLLKFLTRLPRKTLALFMASGAIFVMGAVGFEMLASGNAGFTYALYVAAEEGFEMLGVWLFIYALVDYISVRGYKPALVLDSQ